MKVIKLIPVKEPKSYVWIWFMVFGAGLFTFLIPMMDIFGTASIWVKPDWNIARILLDSVCVIAGFVCSMIGLMGLMIKDFVQKIINLM